MEIDKTIPVLVVEDDPNLRRIIINIIKKIGFPMIREADNGQNAWAVILNAEVSMVITDLNMPVVDGLQLTKMIRGNPKFKHLPVMMITASDTKETIVKAGKVGVDGYLIKPFNVKEILQNIQEALKRAAARNEAAGNG